MMSLFILLVALIAVVFSMAIKFYSITDIILYSIMAILGMGAAMMWLYEVINYDK